MRILFYFLLLLSSGAGAQQGLPPVGSWREHLPYNSTLAVGATPDRIWAATPYSLFWVDPASGETGRLSRNTGLSETGIRTAAFDAASRKGFIAYENGNLDVLTGNSIRNIPDLKRAAVNGDKTVYHITAEDGLAYLSTGLGIVVVDASRYEIRDTWPLGEGGQPLRTFQFVRSGSWMYAATAEGLKRAAATATNPADFQQWTTLSAGLPAGAATGVAAVQNRVFAVVHDSVFASEGGAWTLFFANGHGVRSLRASEEKLLLSQQTSDGKGLVLVLEPDGQLVRTLNDPSLVADPRDALLRQGEYWVADSLRGLSRWSAAGAQRYAPDGPAGIPAGALVAAGEAVYATGGTGGPGRLFRLADGTWTSWDSASVPAFHSLPGLAPLALDPLDASVWAGSDGGGLLHLKKEGTAEVFTGNSPLQPAPGAPGTYRVTGLHFDAAGSLWIANPGSSPYIHLRRPDGSWQSFPVPFSLPGNALGHLLVDGWDQKWILVPGAGLLVWNHGGDIADTGDDQWRWLRAGAGAGNLPSDNVLSLAFDRNGVAWVGTDNGIGVIPCTADVFATTCEAVLPVIQGDNFANYLFKGEAVHAIAVDG
ncbi:MAG TPA: two-component regulator propeller domain-containing protein, partial [Chitinophagaceae bacterium]|nr:two-component regulator propeller domain-containing protein [Chitinophagaceae bacterium]